MSIVEAARRLLANRHQHQTEGNVQSDVVVLLQKMQVGTIESQYQQGQDRADFYLPNRRTFIECKAYPNAKYPERTESGGQESPREQVERYVRAEIERELQLSPSPSLDVPDAAWRGIVTDGSHWHVYRYPHKASAEGILESSKTFLNEGDALAAFLGEALGGEMTGKEWIPDEPSELFSDLKADLDRLYEHLPQRAALPTRTKRMLWLDMMETSGMVPADEAGQTRLFLAHSFLIVIARLVSHTLTGPRRSDKWRDALKEGFASWVLDFTRGEAWAKRVWMLVDKYDWRRRRGDVLRDLYHRYVSDRDRKVFGEFYTPDWLAAFMVEELLDDEWIESATKAVLAGNTNGVGVLDPACGSGTFLYHAAHRILSSPSVRELQPVKQADIVTRLVNGLDIHPVAVEMARVNIERTLPSEPADGASAFRVYLGDSLQAAARGELLFGDTTDAMLLATPNGRQALIPMDLVLSPSFAESMRRIVNAAAGENPLPPDMANNDNQNAMESCHKALTEIVREEGNSVWTWYAVNLAGPHLLAKRKVNRIVANPPWVRLADIQVRDRKRTMEEFGRELGLWAGGTQAPHLDIASYFVLRTRQLYTAAPVRDPAAWLVKKSAIQSGQWAPFRAIHGETLAQSVDLEELNPFNGGDATRCCLLMEHRPMRGTSCSRMKARRTSPTRPSTHDALDAARGMFEFVEAPYPLPQAPSDYDAKNIKQGATIVPHVLTLIKEQAIARRSGWVCIETQRSQHPPWKDVCSQKGEVPEGWVRPIHTSPDLLPYAAIGKPPHAIIPVRRDGTLHHTPGQDCQFWMELDEIYNASRGQGQGTPDTLIKRLDFRSALSRQPFQRLRGRRTVLYPSSGNIMRAARTHGGIAVVDATLYWLTARSEAEAGYLVTLLNANCLRRAFSESRESGRHFHQHPWRKVPIPRYDGRNQDHHRLAVLCGSAETIAARRVKKALSEQPDLGQQGLSTAVREALAKSPTGKEIENIATRLLPKQASATEV